MKPAISGPVLELMNMTDEVVPARVLAPIVKMHPQTIVDYAKTGKWNLCRYIISGDRVKFFRKDFLQQCGFIDPEPDPQDVERAVLTEVIDALQTLLESQEETIRLLTEQNELLRGRMA